MGCKERRILLHNKASQSFKSCHAGLSNPAKKMNKKWQLFILSKLTNH